MGYYFFRHRRRGAPEINIVCSTITPTLGAELVVNGGFTAWTSDNPDSWTITGESGDDPEVSEAATGELHADTPTLGGGMCNLYSSATAQRPIIDQNILTAGDWYHAGVTIDGRGSGSLALYDNLSLIDLRYNTTGVKVGTGRSGGTLLRLRIAAASGDITIDDVTCKKLTLSSLLAALGSLSRQTGTFTCQPTVTDDTQAGLVFNYLDANNFVVMYVDRAAVSVDKAYLVKCVAGTYTEVESDTITYGAATELKCVVDGTTYKLYYDDVQVGSDQTISDTLGTQVYGFSTYASNTVGLVTTSPN